MTTHPTDDDETVAPDSESEDQPDNTGEPTEHEAGEIPDLVDTAQWTQLTQVHYDRNSDEELGTVLAFAIADAKGVDPLDHAAMPPLYNSLDAQALEETFFGPSGADCKQGQDGVVSFLYNSLNVVLRADGWIVVYEPR